MDALADSTCPCGSDSPFAACCGPVIDGSRTATTAEELLRSRYSAFVAGAIDWIIDSHHSDTVGEIDRDEVARWSGDSEWLGLTVRDVVDGAGSDDEGEVTFRARYRADGRVVDHDERAYFVRTDDGWKFHSVLAPHDDGPELVPVAAAATVGRNDPCPCGSGAKFKRCCG